MDTKGRPVGTVSSKPTQQAGQWEDRGVHRRFTDDGERWWNTIVQKSGGRRGMRCNIQHPAYGVQHVCTCTSVHTCTPKLMQMQTQLCKLGICGGSITGGHPMAGAGPEKRPIASAALIRGVPLTKLREKGGERGFPRNPSRHGIVTRDLDNLLESSRLGMVP
jgi:hypothetical protein